MTWWRALVSDFACPSTRTKKLMSVGLNHQRFSTCIHTAALTDQHWIKRNKRWTSTGGWSWSKSSQTTCIGLSYKKKEKRLNLMCRHLQYSKDLVLVESHLDSDYLRLEKDPCLRSPTVFAYGVWRVLLLWFFSLFVRSHRGGSAAFTKHPCQQLF